MKTSWSDFIIRAETTSAKESIEGGSKLLAISKLVNTSKDVQTEARS